MSAKHPRAVLLCHPAAAVEHCSSPQPQTKHRCRTSCTRTKLLGTTLHPSNTPQGKQTHTQTQQLPHQPQPTRACMCGQHPPRARPTLCLCAWGRALPNICPAPLVTMGGWLHSCLSCIGGDTSCCSSVGSRSRWQPRRPAQNSSLAVLPLLPSRPLQPPVHELLCQERPHSSCLGAAQLSCSDVSRQAQLLLHQGGKLQ